MPSLYTKSRLNYLKKTRHKSWCGYFDFYISSILYDNDTDIES